MNPLFAGQGFVYTEESTSPDGTLLVLNGYSDGERSPLLIEPRVLFAATGATLLDLWHTYQNYSLHFGEAGRAILTVQNPYKGKTRLVDIDFGRATFAFRDDPTTVHPLAKLPKMIVLI